MAETAGSLAPRGMGPYAGEKGLWKRMTRRQRQELVVGQVLVWGFLGAIVLLLLTHSDTSYVVAVLVIGLLAASISLIHAIKTGRRESRRP